VSTTVSTTAGNGIRTRAGCTTVRLSGDLDIGATPELRDSLRRVLRTGTELLVIDLSAVPSCDVAVLAVLIGVQRHAAARGIAVRVAAPGPQVAELLRVTGLDRRLMISDVAAGPLPEQWPANANCTAQKRQVA
jgi:anti-anti-sigma factor